MSKLTNVYPIQRVLIAPNIAAPWIQMAQDQKHPISAMSYSDSIRALGGSPLLAAMVNQTRHIIETGEVHRVNCWFHDDQTYAMVIDSGDDTWRCFVCNTSGTVDDEGNIKLAEGSGQL